MTDEARAIIRKTEEISCLTHQLDGLIETSNLSNKDTLFDYVDEIFRASRRIRMIVKERGIK